MIAADEDLSTSRRFADTQRPRDSATLILIRRDGRLPRIFLGKRHATHAFMPELYVFPGGRLDRSDCRTPIAKDLHPDVLRKLTLRMRGGASASRARGLAVAAIRETFEETGLLFGFENAGLDRQRDCTWLELLASGRTPELSGLRLFARAITPPGRTRRFDSRFFVAEASLIANLDVPWHHGSDELLDAKWFSFAEARQLDLPLITRDTLRRLEPRIAENTELPGDCPLCFQYQKGKAWREEFL
jgi:8-oxo-dGTP pyrophosphatase MutT (NUDIX family)